MGKLNKQVIYFNKNRGLYKIIMLMLAILMILVQIPVVVFANTDDEFENANREVIIKEISENNKSNPLSDSTESLYLKQDNKNSVDSKEPEVSSDRSADAKSDNIPVSEMKSDPVNNPQAKDYRNQNSNTGNSKNDLSNFIDRIVKPAVRDDDSKEEFLKKFWIKDIVARQFLDGKPNADAKTKYTIRVGKSKDDRNGKILGRATVVDDE